VSDDTESTASIDSPPVSRIQEQLRRSSNKGTELIARRWGGSLGMWVACGYPKSGTSWLSFLLADYLRLPRPRRYVLPVAMPSVIHAHWRYHKRLSRVVYLHRDGRDVMVSLYFFRMARLDSPEVPRFAAQMRKRYEAAFGSGFDPDDIGSHLARFIEMEMTHPRESRINWADHVTAWVGSAGPGVAVVSYEGLVQRPLETLGESLGRLLGEPVDEERLATSIARYDFRAVTGRAIGEEERGSFHRKGGVGDWRNHFTREAAETFDHYAGAALTAIGYEPDNAWVAAVAAS
jgi:hypothetical protein